MQIYDKCNIPLNHIKDSIFNETLCSLLRQKMKKSDSGNMTQALATKQASWNREQRNNQNLLVQWNIIMIICNGFNWLREARHWFDN